MDTASQVALVGDGILLATLIVFILQARAMTQQGAATALATRSGVYQAITESMINVDRLFVERPELRGYFYGGLPLPDDPVERARVEATTELLVDFLDNVITQAPHLPEYLNGPWVVYAQALMESSLVLTDFWGANRSWYSDQVQRVMDPLYATALARRAASAPPQPLGAEVPTGRRS